MASTTDRRILVTGASGFIGRHALRPLLNRGFEVHAVSRAVPSDAPAGVSWHNADLLDHDAADALINRIRPTHLLHFAWCAEHGKFWTAPENLDWLAATLNLLRLFAAAGGKRFVGAGTCAEYDWAETDLLDEVRTPLRPATLYGAAKASAFLSGTAFANTVGLSFAWGRIFHLFGEGEAPARLIPALIRTHLRCETLNCGPSDSRRDFLPVESVADAFAALCESGVAGPINIGSGQGTTLLELSEKIADLVGSRGVVHFGIRKDSGPETLVPSVSRITGATPWRPPGSLEKALVDAVDWWKTRT